MEGAATSSYSATTDFLQHIYSALVVKYHEKIRSRCSVYEFSFTYTLNDINDGYRAVILKKNYLRLLPFHMAVKRRAERCAVQLYGTSLRSKIDFLFIIFSQHILMQSLSLEEENIIKDIRNYFWLEKDIKTIKDKYVAIWGIFLSMDKKKIIINQ